VEKPLSPRSDAMSITDFYAIQLEWIRALHSALRSPWMDTFFIGWNYVDTYYFSLIVIILTWYLWNRHLGVKLFYLLTLSFVVNQTLKTLFHEPRPCQLDPALGLICSDSFGLPSGAAQTAALLSGFIILECKRRLYHVLGLLFALMLCFSRVYLGMHFFTDILGGLIVGCVLLWVYRKIFPLFQPIWKITAIVFPLVLLFTLPSMFGPYLCFSVLGVACGLISAGALHVKEHVTLLGRFKQLLTICIGVGVFMILQSYCPQLRFLWDFCLGYWVSFLGAYLIGKKSRYTKSKK
jgi:membrane-associated phospholipid phosphatase